MNLPKKLLVFIFEVVAVITLFEVNLYFSALDVKKTKPSFPAKVYSTISFGKLLTYDLPHPQVLAAFTPESTPPPLLTPKKKTYLIAAIGDSMVETMGDSLEYLQKDMRAKYPKTNFVFYNYGVGSENIETALARFDKPFDQGNRHYGSLPSLRPDIIILGSWAYNPLTPHDRDRHWSLLSDIVRRAKETGAKVYLLAEIAPLKSGFGNGPGGVNWPDDMANLQAGRVIEQLENAVGLAKTLGVPLLDAFDASKGNGNYGRTELINFHDGIHPSVLGHQFIANLITSKISLP